MKTQPPMQAFKESHILLELSRNSFSRSCFYIVTQCSSALRDETKTAARETSRVKPTAHFGQPNIPSCSSMIAFSLSDSEKYLSCASLHFFFATSHSFLNVSISLLSTRFIEFCTKNERKYLARCVDKDNWEFKYGVFERRTSSGREASSRLVLLQKSTSG